MVIYLDLLVVYDVLINIAMLIIIYISFNDKLKMLRIILSSVLSGIMLVLSIYSHVLLDIFKLIGGLLISLVAFNGFFKTRKMINLEKLLKIGSFYTFNFSFVGLLHIFNIRNWYYLILIFSILIFLILLISLKKYVIFMKTSEYSVIVKIENNYYNLKGFLDTGNKSTYKGMPIVYLKEKYCNDVTDTELVSVKTISGVGYLKGMMPEVFVIENNKMKKAKKVFVCFSCIEEDCILNPLLFIWEV